jgi:hypothetical protein
VDSIRRGERRWSGGCVERRAVKDHRRQGEEGRLFRDEESDRRRVVDGERRTGGSRGEGEGRGRLLASSVVETRGSEEEERKKG